MTSPTAMSSPEPSTLVTNRYLPNILFHTCLDQRHTMYVNSSLASPLPCGRCRLPITSDLGKHDFLVVRAVNVRRGKSMRMERRPLCCSIGRQHTAILRVVAGNISLWAHTGGMSLNLNITCAPDWFAFFLCTLYNCTILFLLCSI